MVEQFVRRQYKWDLPEEDMKVFVNNLRGSSNMAVFSMSLYVLQAYALRRAGRGRLLSYTAPYFTSAFFHVALTADKRRENDALLAKHQANLSNSGESSE
eukprot:CAMPEP_0114996820 /NCGR_PEP_ID=MMETSP0216-20121206/14544_1 /TAXON_ID=223996 /ORGANISM="Protocruzia adherens, Strain Boccale" /LENGTH=99 /DNA_ID=CAMNT_0002361109 /DNA_START=30 /DNA_END=329 /DNA_ORIENTATION=+